MTRNERTGEVYLNMPEESAMTLYRLARKVGFSHTQAVGQVANDYDGEVSAEFIGWLTDSNS